MQLLLRLFVQKRNVFEFYPNIANIILLLFLRLRPKAFLPAFLQMVETDVAYALVCALWIGQVMDRGLNGKQQWSSSGA
jgi:hypothetical protein